MSLFPRLPLFSHAAQQQEQEVQTRRVKQVDEANW